MTSVAELVKMLYSEGFFSEWRSMNDVKESLRKIGFNFNDPLIHTSLLNVVKRGILIRRQSNKLWEYSQRQPPEVKIRKEEITELNKVLSEITEKNLGERFQQDIKELNISFTYDCGSSAAFILRKILEKVIFHVFAGNNKLDLLKDSSGKMRGLESAIHVCSNEKINGVFILMPKTSENLLGMKFLGDSAAHNPLINVEVTDINPQLPYWTTAIKELIVNLK